MVGTTFAQRFDPLSPVWARRLVDVTGPTAGADLSAWGRLSPYG